MASWGAAIAASLAERSREKRRYVAEQKAKASERLERIMAERQRVSSTVQENLRLSSDFLTTKGFSNSEISQLLENDPAEVTRLAAKVKEKDLSADDVRTVASFREDYTPELPLSELIKRAAPAIRDIDEPDPVARQQNIFQRMFGMDTSADRDRFMRESNFGGFSGYDILASQGASPYREPSGDRLIDYGGMPKAVSPTELKEYRKEITLSILDYGLQIENDDSILDDRLKQKFGNAVKDKNTREIQRMLFDTSNPAQYNALSTYRERLLEEMTFFYEKAPSVFDQPTFKDLGFKVAEFVSDKEETEGGVAPVTDTAGPTVTEQEPVVPEGFDLGEVTEDNAQDILDTILSSDEERFVVNGRSVSKDQAMSMLADVFGVEVPLPGVDTERSGLVQDVQSLKSSKEVDRLFSSALTRLRIGEYGPGTAPISRFIRYVFETDKKVLDEAEVIQEAEKRLSKNKDKILEIITYDQEARDLLEENPLEFLEKYSEQLNGD